MSIWNWWLKLNENRTDIGFWPKQIFTNLGDRATEAEWGGEVFSPPDVPSPGMGSGHLLKLDTRYDAFSAHTNILVNNTIMNPGELLPIEDVNNFTVSDQGNVGGDIRYLILYGGPGGVTGN